MFLAVLKRNFPGKVTRDLCGVCLKYTWLEGCLLRLLSVRRQLLEWNGGSAEAEFLLSPRWSELTGWVSMAGVAGTCQRSRCTGLVPASRGEVWSTKFTAVLSHHFCRACGFWLPVCFGVCCCFRMYFRYLGESWMPCVIPASREDT